MRSTYILLSGFIIGLLSIYFGYKVLKGFRGIISGSFIGAIISYLIVTQLYHRYVPLIKH